jgi:YD repeat-containing protein
MGSHLVPVLGVLLLMAIGCGEPRARLAPTEILRRVEGEPDELQRLQYDEDGCPSRLEFWIDDLLGATIFYECADGRPVRSRVEDHQGKEVFEQELRWMDGRLVGGVSRSAARGEYVTEIEYEPWGDPRSIRRVGPTSASRPSIDTVEYWYVDGRVDRRVLRRTTMAADAVERSDTLSFRWDARGRIDRVDDEVGGSLSFDWDDEDRLVAQRFSLGLRYEVLYDDEGRISELRETSEGRLLRTSYRYADHETSGVLVTPELPLDELLDLRGHVHGAPALPRLADL